MIRFDDDDLPGFGFDASDDALDALESEIERDDDSSFDDEWSEMPLEDDAADDDW